MSRTKVKANLETAAFFAAADGDHVGAFRLVEYIKVLSAAWTQSDKELTAAQARAKVRSAAWHASVARRYYEYPQCDY